MGSTTSPLATCSRSPALRRPPRTAPPPICSSPPPGGPTCTRRSRSTTRLRSPSRVASTRNRSPARVRRWWRSSASPSSAPSSGISTTAAKKLVGHALELRHRLPRLWAQVQAGRVPAWRARSVAEVTIHTTPALTREAAAFVDAQVAAVAGRVGAAQLDRLVAEAIKRYDLADGRPGRRIRRTATSTSTPVTRRSTTTTSTSPAPCGSRPSSTSPTPSTSTGPSPTAPQTLKALGSDASLDARRSAALGDLARTQTALDLAGAGADRQHLPAAREVVLHAHFDASLDGLATVFGPTGRMEEGQRLVLLDQVKDWCGDSRTKVTVKPVIDLNAELSTPAYEVPDRIREQVILRDRDLRVPVVHPTGPGLRHRPRRRVRPPRRGRGPTTARSYADRQPRGAVPVPPPPQDPHRLALPDDRSRGLRMDLAPRPPLPAGPFGHDADRRWVRAARSTMTTPHTLPTSSRRGQSHVRWAHHDTGHRAAVWTAHLTGRWRTYPREGWSPWFLDLHRAARRLLRLGLLGGPQAKPGPRVARHAA